MTCPFVEPPAPAIVKTCVDACGGTVTARNREPRGFEVRIHLPAAV